MTENNPTEQGIFRKILSHYSDENIDALDPIHVQFFERLIPGMRPEHTLRYIFAAQQLKDMKVKGKPLVIDAATGQAYGAKIIKEMVPEATIIGFDIQQAALKVSQEKYGQYGKYVQGDIRHLPVDDAKADMVIALETLEHLAPEDQPVFLRELKRITKPNGRVVISVPYPSSTYRGKDNKVHHAFGSGSHLYEPTVEETNTMIEGAGFKIIGQYGQVITDSREAKAMSVVNRVLPIWGMYAWLPKRDNSVQPLPNQPNTIPLIHVVVAQPA